MGRGVDSRLFNPAKRCPELRRSWGIREQDLALLYVGRIAGEKNLQVAVDAYRAAARFRPTVKFVIVGDGPQRSALQAQHPDIVCRGRDAG